MQKDFIYKSAGILIRDRRLLVERSQGKDFFASPGGKANDGETGEQTLIRELKEEFNIDIREGDLAEFGVFEADAFGKENAEIRISVFMVQSYIGEPTPNAEVEEIRWIESSNPEGLKLGSIFEHDVIPKLKKMGLID